MIVVSDSSSITTLAKLDRLEILPALYDEVAIPNEVVAELLLPTRSPELRTWISRPPNWLTIKTVGSVLNIPELDAGECAAIGLFGDLAAKYLLIDERRGRRIARSRNIPIIGTVGVLEAAAQDGLLDLQQTFEQLKLTDFWIDHDFLDAVLARFQANK